MKTNVLEYLENSVKRVPDKLAFANLDTKLTYKELYDRARGVGTYLAGFSAGREPVIVYMSKSPHTGALSMPAVFMYL
jgi:acyl-CoA synthetase (AMP-forming)/AMP-acid ligase II